MLMFISSLAHFLVDGLCISCLFGQIAQHGDIALAVLIYNTLAFSTQCIAGLITDATGRWAKLCSISMFAVVLGFALPVHWMIKLVLISLGNSLFHVTGGSMVLNESGGEAAKLGVFVAPGAIGVTLGTLWPELRIFFALALIICAIEMWAISIRKKDDKPQKCAGSAYETRVPVLLVVLLVVAVAVRAVGGSAVSFPWKSGAWLSVLMTVFVFAGKAAGGFVCDKLGPAKSAYFSLPIAALLIAFGSTWVLPSILGQFLLNLSMPVTLWLLYKAMPDSPGFAFGLAASALWPGTIAGQLFSLTGPALWICIVISFIFGLFAIVYAEKRLRRIKV